jgi:glycosyltransferase involved in cell wall biosynthesis
MRKFLATSNLYQSASHLVAWSGLVKESLICDYDVPAENISVIPPGIDLDLWSVGKVGIKNRESRERRVRILFVGGDFKRKGGDLILKLAQEENFRTCQFDFVTRSGPSMNLDSVHFHTQLTANSDQLLSLYRNADIFVLPSWADFSPTIALCEALAMELPTICTNVGGINEYISDGINGYLVDRGNVDDLRSRLLLLISDPGLRRTIGQMGRKTAEKNFEINRNAQKMFTIMRNVARQQRAVA